MSRYGIFLFASISFFAFLTGCAHVPPIQPRPTAQPTSPSAGPSDPILSHLLGVWKNSDRGGTLSEMEVQPGGAVIFSGGLAYLNPVVWELDRQQRELTLTLPQAANEKLDIFHLQVGEGVKRFNRAQKQVVFEFDEHTAALNIAGWMYSKHDESAAPVAAESEPVIK